MAIFHSAHLKLKRARQIIDEMDAMATVHLEQNPVTTKLVRVDPPEEGGWANFETKIPEVPEMLSVLIGDVIHNIRSALDHMASEMARMNGKSDKHVYFPFAENAGGLTEMIKKKNFDYCGKEAVDLLRTLRPYRGGNDELRAIHDLDILDKHRELVPRAYVNVPPPKLLEVGYTEEGKRVGRPIFPQFTGKPKFVFPPDMGVLSERPIITTLKRFVDNSEGVLKVFAALKTGDDTGANSANDIRPEA